MGLNDGLTKTSYNDQTIYAYKLSEKEHIGLVSLPWGTTQDIKNFMLVNEDDKGNKIKVNFVLNCHYFDMEGKTYGYLGRCQSFTVDGRTVGYGEDGFVGYGDNKTDKPYIDLVILKDGTIKYGDFNSWDYPKSDVILGVAPAGVELDNGEDKSTYSPACGWSKITTANTQSLLIKCDDGRFALVAVTGELSPNTCREWTKSIGGTHQSCYDSGGSTQAVARNTDGSLNVIRKTTRSIPTAFVAYEIIDENGTGGTGGGTEEVEKQTFSISYNLTNVTVSNNIKTITENEEYTTTISANEGYRLSSVNITMNGYDITSSNYSDGELTIPSVTGNIAITAIAEEIPTEIIKYAISYKLTNVSIDNSTSEVEQYAKYETNILVDDEYNLSSVVVKMNNTNITSEVLSGNHISIPSVTGNIVIQIIANPVQMPDYRGEVSEINNKINQIKTEKALLKTRFLELGVDMTHVPFTEYHTKINDTYNGYKVVTHLLTSPTINTHYSQVIDCGLSKSCHYSLFKSENSDNYNSVTYIQGSMDSSTWSDVATLNENVSDGVTDSQYPYWRTKVVVTNCTGNSGQMTTIFA